MSTLTHLLPLVLGQATAEHVEEMSRTVGAGKIVGGWEYVWASYLIAWAGMKMLVPRHKPITDI